ncbi:MAG: hypothetical protein HKP61_07510 [Dactylosporangium sp.]|nr:hypothetical protein [Dactylosporangium sp.]NNJ60787.1 hypothetical protein [Dactylosporangium sp.]
MSPTPTIVDGLHLGVDLTTPDWIVAAAGPGTTTPIVLRLPSGVYTDPTTGTLTAATAAAQLAATTPTAYLPDLTSLLSAGATPDGQDLVALAAAALGGVCTEATHAAGGGPVTALMLVLPAGWGPQRRDLLRRAARRADLPTPRFATPAAAITTAHQAGAAPVDGYLLVAETTPTGGTLTVVATSNREVDLVATTTLADRGTDQVSATVDTLLTTADLTTSDLVGVLLVDPVPTPGLAEALAATTGRTVTPLAASAAAWGALHATTSPGHGTAEPTAAAPATTSTDPADRGLSLRDQVTAVVRPQLGYATAVMLAGLGAFGVLTMTIIGADAYPDPTGRPGNVVPAGYSGFATTTVILMLVLVAVAYLAATATPTLPRAEAAKRLAHAYLAAAGIGLVTAGLVGLFATTVLGLGDTPVLRWSLQPPLPIALLAVVTGLAATRIPTATLPIWLRRTRPPMTPVLVTAVGTMLVTFHLTIPRPLSVPANVYSTAGAVGAAAIGVGIALTLTAGHRFLRLALIAVLGIGAALVYTLNTMGVFAIGYAIAVALATTRTTATTLALAFPELRDLLSRLLRRLLPTDQPTQASTHTAGAPPVSSPPGTPPAGPPPTR